MITPEDSTTMDVPEVADYVGCSTSMVRKLIRQRAIPFYKAGTKIIFKKSVIDRWISNQFKKEGFIYE